MRAPSLSIVVLLCCALLAGCAAQPPEREPQRPPVLLAVFAHPDDETSVGAVLAKYAAAGAQVYLAAATDGRLGVSPHAGLTAGDGLAQVRTQELRCAAERLGLRAPIEFGLHDQLRMGEGLKSYGEQLVELRNRVRKLFAELQPDVVITWPPSGWSGHPDHRIVSAVVTEVFLSQRSARPVELYYPGVPTGRLPDAHPYAGASMDPRFLTKAVPVSESDYDKARAALLCHRSQYSPEQMQQLFDSLVAFQQGMAHFKPLVGDVGERGSLLPE